jgi:anhydro-N-acetylmuramic acid kinase
MATRIIGVMSGSSLDGLDMAICRFAGDPAMPAWEILDTHHAEFPADWRQRLIAAPDMSGRELMHADAAFGRFIGEQVLGMMRRTQLSTDLIASHGHTIFHEPGHGFTTQIGDGAWIAAITGVDTVTSFRGADVALGGQGAPFAPAADIALFPQFGAYINLGGIVNAHVRLPDGRRRAWDIGPCNQPLNWLAARINLPHDPDGRIAREGQADEYLVQALTELFPPAGGAPRGLSNDMVRETWINRLQGSTLDTHNLLATVTEAIARMITAHLSDVAMAGTSVMVTGGGAYNRFLMDRLESLGKARSIYYVRPPDIVIGFKECLLMAYLGYLFMRRRPFGLAGVTGAARESVGGAYYIGRHES